MKRIAALLFFSPALFAQEFIESEDFYLSFQAGISFSTDTDMDVATGTNPDTDWYQAPEGYNSTLDNSEVLGFALGYVIHPLIAIELEAAHRNSFEYTKVQTGSSPKTRYFDFVNTTVMANAVFNGSGLSKPFAYQSGSVLFDPFIKAGVGVAFNTVEDFHTITSHNQALATMADNTESAFAYQIGAGINMRMEDSFVLGAGYRYLSGGDFSSNNYLLNDFTVVTPWEGDFATNEVYLSLSYVLD